jgi:hypothetical protein
LNEQFSYNYNNSKHNHCLGKISLRLDNFFILLAVIVQSLFYNQKRKDLVKNQRFVIGIITIFVIVISDAFIATLVKVDKFGIREIYQKKMVVVLNKNGILILTIQAMIQEQGEKTLILNLFRRILMAAGR